MIPDNLLAELQEIARNISIRVALMQAYNIGKADGLGEIFKDIADPKPQFTTAQHNEYLERRGDCFREDYGHDS